MKKKQLQVVIKSGNTLTQKLDAYKIVGGAQKAGSRLGHKKLLLEIQK